jgi:hypothetical protein
MPNKIISYITGATIRQDAHTYTFRLFSEEGADPRYQFLRERVFYVNGVKVYSQPTRDYSISLSGLAGEVVTLPNGTSVTPTQINRILELLGDLVEDKVTALEQFAITGIPPTGG